MPFYWTFSILYLGHKVEGNKQDLKTKNKGKDTLLRYYSVFHIDQCEGIKPKFAFAERANNPQAEEVVHHYVSGSGVSLIFSVSDTACYVPSKDEIRIPHSSSFSQTAEYYSTLFHEMVHSTGSANRLNRIAATSFFGGEEYSKEELIAEIGAAALVHHCGLETKKSFRNSAAYIQNWLMVLKNDKRCIVSASAKAEKAVQYILE